MPSVKVTVDISAPLLREAMRFAAREGVTLGHLIERTLHDVMAEAVSSPGFKRRKRSIKGQDLRPELRGVSWNRIRDMIYDGRG